MEILWHCKLLETCKLFGKFTSFDSADIFNILSTYSLALSALPLWNRNIPPKNKAVSPHFVLSDFNLASSCCMDCLSEVLVLLLAMISAISEQRTTSLFSLIESNSRIASFKLSKWEKTVLYIILVVLVVGTNHPQISLANSIGLFESLQSIISSAYSVQAT